jgi:hypothetical protein
MRATLKAQSAGNDNHETLLKVIALMISLIFCCCPLDYCPRLGRGFDIAILGLQGSNRFKQ